MTIQKIKSDLSIQSVLNHYGLQTNKNGMLRCPFHADQKASMKVYGETNTVYCFAGSCKVEALDTIDFIMQKENLTKHEAILKAKSLLNIVSVPRPSLSKSKPVENHIKIFNRYVKALHTHSQARAYLEGRGLNPQLIEIGYKSRKTKEVWGRGCVMFPLKNELGQIVSMYGRSVYGDGHYYKSNRSGLYPCYPDKETTVIILVESIIDAASMWDNTTLKKSGYALLSLFGTNGLTSEHKLAISKLEKLEEIILVFDGDEAGRSAMVEHGSTLNDLCVGVKISGVDLPEGEDVNSMYVSHTDKEGLFSKLLESRKRLNEKVEVVKESVLDVSNKYNLKYEGLSGEYRIKGFAPERYGADKITLQIINKN